MARDAVIVGSLRTGLAKAHRGSFNLTEPVQYTAHVLREVLAQQPNLDPAGKLLGLRLLRPLG